MPRWPDRVPRESLEPQEVIVRAYGDEPVRLLAIGVEKNRILVASTPAGQPLGWWPELLVPYTPERWELLREAFATGNAATLRRAWEIAHQEVPNASEIITHLFPERVVSEVAGGSSGLWRSA